MVCSQRRKAEKLVKDHCVFFYAILLFMSLAFQGAYELDESVEPVRPENARQVIV